MAINYFDSALSGAEIEAVLQNVNRVAISANAGMHVAIDSNGKLVAEQPPAEYDDAEIKERIAQLENTFSGLVDGDEVSY